MRKKTVRKFLTDSLAFVLGVGLASGMAYTQMFQDANVCVALGAKQTTAEGNWKTSDGGWWYEYGDGTWVTGWKQIGNTWYFFDDSGWMQTGWLNTRNVWYYLQASGAMTEGWANLGGTWYYLSPGNGAMQTGWFTDTSGAWYYADGSGAMASNRWIGDYYVGSNGVMATNCWIGDYYVGSDGRWLPGGPSANEPESDGGSSSEHVHNWTWSTGIQKIKHGSACNGCSQDLTEWDWDDRYWCCGGFHTHQWYLFPTYSTCESCDVKKHEHAWYYVVPDYVDGTDEIYRDGYWCCYRCGNQSRDGKTTEPISISEKGFKRGAIDMWITPYDFSADGDGKWVLVDESWEKPPSVPSLQHIDIEGDISLAPGHTGKYQVTFTPASAAESVTFKSSNSSVISIDNAGNYTAHKSGTATITAETASGSTASIFVRVTSSDIGTVKNATLLVNGSSNPDSAIKLDGNGKNYTVTLQTEPEQAVYQVSYTIENEVCSSDYSPYKKSVWISGSALLGSISLDGWENGPFYTKPETQISTGKPGTATIVAKITDINGNVTVLKQPVRIN